MTGLGGLQHLNFPPFRGFPCESNVPMSSRINLVILELRSTMMGLSAPNTHSCGPHCRVEMIYRRFSRWCVRAQGQWIEERGSIMCSTLSFILNLRKSLFSAVMTGSVVGASPALAWTSLAAAGGQPQSPKGLQTAPCSGTSHSRPLVHSCQLGRMRLPDTFLCTQHTNFYKHLSS